MSCSEIISGLFLSDATFASCKACLSQHSIANVLTVDVVELSFRPCFSHKTTAEESYEINNRFLHVLDDSRFDLLKLLQDCLEFIDETLSRNVLVHCHAGQSRSATVVIAYLIKRNQWSLQDTLKFVKSKKHDITPNPGFIRQLEIFEQSGNNISSCPLYRQFIIQLETQQKTGCFLSDFKMALTEENKNYGYKCRKCRIQLATSSELRTPHSSLCSSLHFVEPPDWLRIQMKGEVQGKISCWNCSSKLGAFNWAGDECERWLAVFNMCHHGYIAGKPCSCGDWITPSFQMNKSKLDQTIARFLCKNDKSSG